MTVGPSVPIWFLLSITFFYLFQLFLVVGGVFLLKKQDKYEYLNSITMVYILNIFGVFIALSLAMKSFDYKNKYFKPKFNDYVLDGLGLLVSLSIIAMIVLFIFNKFTSNEDRIRKIQHFVYWRFNYIPSFCYLIFYISLWF